MQRATGGRGNLISLTTPYWYAFVTRPRHEKRVEKQLCGNGIECYLPLHRVVRRWKDRRKQVELPLFSCYIFAHISYFKRYDVLMVPGVVRIVAIGNQPTPVRDEEIEAVRRLLEAEVQFELSPELHYGDRVRVVAGPLTGIEGELVDFRGSSRVALNVGVVGQSLLVEVERSKLICIARAEQGLRRDARPGQGWRDFGVSLP